MNFRQNCTLTDLGYITNVLRVLLFDLKILKGLKCISKLKKCYFRALPPWFKRYVSCSCCSLRGIVSSVRENLFVVTSFLKRFSLVTSFLTTNFLFLYIFIYLSLV